MEYSLLLCTVCSFLVFQPAASDQVVESFHVFSDIRYRFATTQISSEVKNNANESVHLYFEVILPKHAFITAFHMTVDGQRYDGVVTERKAGKDHFYKAVDQGLSAGQVHKVDRGQNLFPVEVNVAGNKSVRFVLTYQEQLRRKHGFYDHAVYVKLFKPVEDLSVQVQVLENRPLIGTPLVMTKDLVTNEIKYDLSLVTKRTPETASILYEPTVTEQGKGLQIRFVLQYYVEQAPPGGDILVVDGYFVHFLSPDNLGSPIPKNILFVLDISGSMWGEKITQMKLAMTQILSEVKDIDRLNIVPFSGDVLWWQSSLVNADTGNIALAKAFVNNLNANGGTKINLALCSGLEELHNKTDEDRVGMIFFLTDGQGETNKATIINNASEMNNGSFAIISLAFGDWADYEFLKQLSAKNRGIARKIYVDSDAGLQISALYKEVSAVSIKDMQITYLENTVVEASLTQTHFPTVFNGTEIIVSGQLPNPEPPAIKYEISGQEEAGDIDIKMEVKTEDTSPAVQDTRESDLIPGPRDYSGLMEKMWAYRTINELLIQEHVVDNDPTRVDAARDRAMQMALEYGLVTPVTSLVVNIPGGDQPSIGDLDETMELDSVASFHDKKLHPPVAVPTQANQKPVTEPGDTNAHEEDPYNGRQSLICNRNLVFVLTICIKFFSRNDY